MEEIKKEKEELQRIEKERKPGWLENVPYGYKLVALVIIGFLFYRMYIGVADIKQTLGLVAFVLLILYFLGTTALTTGMLTPREAVLLARKEIDQYPEVWHIPQFSSYKVINCSPPRYIYGKPKYYQVGIEVRTIDGGIRYRIIEVDCFIGVQGFYDTRTKPYGTIDEVGVSHGVLPQFLKDAKKIPEILKFWK